MASESLYERILSHFPEGIVYSCAYGSGVFQQDNGENTANNVIDFIFVVNNTSEWHKENIKLNKSHYSFLRYLGPSAVSTVQERMGAGIYYNPLVLCEDRRIKYGVIGVNLFCKDLKEWKSLYVSGRLHKPVFLIKPEVLEPMIASALEYNLESALRASLLLLPENFTDYQLYTTIATMSYNGDFRMLVGEDKQKIKNIVNGSMEDFDKLYHPFFRTSHPMSKFVYLKGNGNLRQSFSPQARCEHLCALPSNLKKKILQKVIAGLKRDGSIDMQEAIFSNISIDPLRCKVLVRHGLSSIVRESSIKQSLKGILTAGIWKSLIYSGRKIQKMMRGLIR